MPTKSTKVKAKSGGLNKSGLNKKQLTHLEKRLLEERARVIKELGHYGESFNSSLQASDGDLSSYSFHMADQGTDAMEREKQFLFASQEGRYLWHVNEALRRLQLPIIGDTVQLRLVYNEGAAFGLHVGDNSRWIFMALAVVALFVLASLVRSTRPGDRFRLLALALVCGGAVGNLIDRIRSAQGVVDFVDVGVGAWRWPTF